MSETLTLPVLPLRETVIFPGVNSAIGAGRAATLRAIQRAADQEDKLLFAVSQRENLDEVRPEILFTIGTIARIGQLQRVSGGVQMLLHGVKRGIAMRYSPANDHLEAVVRRVIFDSLSREQIDTLVELLDRIESAARADAPRHGG